MSFLGDLSGSQALANMAGNLAQNSAMNQGEQAAIAQQQAAAAQQQAMLNNLYGSQGFGGQTAQYAGAGAAYGRATGGFNGGGASVFDTGTTPFNSYGYDPNIGQQYLQANPDVAAAGIDPWVHYQQYGQYEGRSWGGAPAAAPNPQATLGYDPNTLYQNSMGYPGGATSSYFNPATYAGGQYSPADASAYLQANPDVAAAGIDPWTHYQMFGQKEGRTWGSGGNADFGGAAAAPQNPAPTYHPNQGENDYFNQITQQASAAAAYLAANPDVAASGMDPWQHYQLYGQKEGRGWSGPPGGPTATLGYDPNTLYQNSMGYPGGATSSYYNPATYGSFGMGVPAGQYNQADASAYLQANPDVAAAGVDPWTHYQMFGKNEGRAWGSGGGSAVVAAGSDPSWFSAGQPGSGFNPYGMINSGNIGTQDGFGGYSPAAAAYLQANPDVAAAGIDPWVHYQMYGQREGRTWNGAAPTGQSYGPGYFDQTFGAANSQPQAYNPTYGGGYPGAMASDAEAQRQQMIKDLYKTLGIIDNSGEGTGYSPYDRPAGSDSIQNMSNVGG